MENGKIIMAHGSGGRLSHELIRRVFQQAFDNQWLSQMNDAAELPVGPGKLAITTDSFVVTPLFFRGGNIGKIAVCGTVNDLTVSGAIAEYLTAGFILEEGFDMAELESIVKSMAETAKSAGVHLVAGDTKVVEKGSADKLFINTTGVGFIPPARELGPGKIAPGDKIIVTGSMGDHGIAIISEREGLSFSSAVPSDCAVLNDLIESFIVPGVKCMRDPTRGGLATTLNELAGQAGLSMVVAEDNIPVLPAVRAACDMLGLDPLYLANEGKAIVIVSPVVEQQVLLAMHQHSLGQNAQSIGEVVQGEPGLVLIETALGAKRILGMLEGEHLPRIC